MSEVPLPPLLAPGATGAPPASDAAVAPARLPVHLRHTTRSRQRCAVNPDSITPTKALQRRDDRAQASSLPRLAVGAAVASAPAVLPHRAENLHELVQKKRQIFLAQMSLDTKHSEVAKLEQRAQQREEALTASRSFNWCRRRNRCRPHAPPPQLDSSSSHPLFPMHPAGRRGGPASGLPTLRGAPQGQ